MKTRLFLSLIVSLATLTLYSQTQEDALRYSRTQLLGSARYMAMGGAYGSIGADFSGLAVNPAGIGMFRRSEFAFTPLISFSETEASYFNQLTDDSKYNLSLGNIGFVYTSELSGKSKEAGWERIQFGFGYNRINNFNNRIYIQGFNNNSSMMTGYAHMADGNLPENLDKFTTGLAYDAWLIWPMDDSVDPLYDTDAYFGNVMQQQTITTSGSMSEMSFSIGSTYKDRLYIGASVGIPSIRYKYESEYKETDPDNRYPEFVSLTRRENIETRGSGVNLKLGAILRATDWLRLGAAFHTPTFYSNMRDDWRYRMSSQLILDNKFENRSAESPRGRFDYELTTPMRAIGSATVLFGKSGLVSAEYEFADYSEVKLNSSSYKYVDENRAMRDNYTAAHNLKFGTEWRLNDVYFRGGYAVFGSPYKSGVNDGSGNQLSLGLGLRQQDYYIDFAWVNSTFKEDRYMYWVPQGEGLDFISPVANQTFNRQLFMLTLGWRF
jgi:hypothetical protein